MLNKRYKLHALILILILLVYIVYVCTKLKLFKIYYYLKLLNQKKNINLNNKSEWKDNKRPCVTHPSSPYMSQRCVKGAEHLHAWCYMLHSN